MSRELSQVSSITDREGDGVVTSNQSVHVYVANMYIDRADLTAIDP